MQLRPDAILVVGTPVYGLARETRAVPIVFVRIYDPVETGLVDSLARPGGNITGFTLYDASLTGKWLEILKEIAPRVTKVSVLFYPETKSQALMLRGVEAAASSAALTAVGVGVHDASEIERAFAGFEHGPAAGLIVLPSPITIANRKLITALAARHKLPAVYPFRFFTADGGLASYGADLADQYRRGVGYVDRLLRGTKPADLPVQNASKFEFVINMKTAEALGLTPPQSILARADEVVE